MGELAFLVKLTVYLDAKRIFRVRLGQQFGVGAMESL